MSPIYLSSEIFAAHPQVMHAQLSILVPSTSFQGDPSIF